MSSKVNYTDRMGNEKLFPLLVSMSVPGILGTMTTFFYQTIDKIFVGQYVGRDALGAISVLSPVNNIVIALNLFITVGGAAMLSLNMGKQDFDKANKLFTNIVVQAFTMSAVLAIIFSLFTEQFVTMCGTPPSSSIFIYAVDFLRITAPGQIFNMLNVGLAAVIRSEGNTKYSLYASIVGAVLNIFLNIICVALLGWGIKGSALATVASQLVGAIFSGMYFIGKRSVLRWVGFHCISIRQMFQIARMGIAPSIFQMLSFTANIIINRSLKYYGDLDSVYSAIGGGDLAISAVAVVNTVDQFIISLTSGINQAVSPVISYNYGRRLYKRVRKASLISQIMAFAFAIVIWVSMMLLPEMLFNIFSNGDKDLISYGVMAMRITKIFAAFGGYQMLVSMYFSAIGKPQVATLVSLSRNGIFLIPGLLILPSVFGLTGVLLANPVSDGFSLIVVTFMYGKEMKRLKSLRDGEMIESKNLMLKKQAS